MRRVWQGLWGILLLAGLGAGPACAQTSYFLSASGPQGPADGQFNGPSAVAVPPAAPLLVADTHNDRLQLLDPAGKFLSTFGSRGSANGQFSSPAGVAVSPDGTIVGAGKGGKRNERLE